MPNIDITIPLSVLQAGQKFKTRYRLLPNGAFTSNVDRTNAQFTLFGLAAGDYEMEIIFVLADDTECPDAPYYFSIVPEFTCGDFVTQLVERPANSNLFALQVSFSLASIPPCGWEVVYNQGGGNITVNYPTLTVSPVYIPMANKATSVAITALLCTGEKECFTSSVPSIPSPSPCTPAVLLFGEIIAAPFAGQPDGLYVFFTQSTPPTSTAHFVWQQTGTPITPNTPLDKGQFIQSGYIFGQSGGNSTIVFQINPVPTVGLKTYILRMLDRCGIWHQITVVG
jgi:hypothetical protein